MELCDSDMYDGSLICTDLTLQLWVGDFPEIERHVRDARAYLAGAGEARWQSVAADHFRASLDDVDTMLGLVLVMRQQADNAWARLIAAARAAGHPVA